MGRDTFKGAFSCQQNNEPKFRFHVGLVKKNQPKKRKKEVLVGQRRFHRKLTNDGVSGGRTEMSKSPILERTLMFSSAALILIQI